MNLRWWSYSWYHPYLLMFLHIFMYHFANKTIRRKMLLIFMNLSNYRVYTFGKMLSLKIKSFRLKLTMENNRGNKIISRVLFIFFTWCIFLNVHIAFSIFYSDHLMKITTRDQLNLLSSFICKVAREGGRVPPKNKIGSDYSLIIMIIMITSLLKKFFLEWPFVLKLNMLA